MRILDSDSVAALFTFSIISLLFEAESEVANSRRSFEEAPEEATNRVTRSIMIIKPPQANQKDSPPVSPAGSTPPVSPFAGGGGREAFRFRRRSASFAYEKASGVGPKSPPPPYDL
ncbi:UNVERIFIED_CONTAM: Dormancy-associated protein3 [Sesamum radiatum]|uniref:Dormancy-associated protein3 n=1 Tax=Sesamum radiatum TaxID=300843 RepID=A0AAW2RXB7_SESRA